MTSNHGQSFVLIAFFVEHSSSLGIVGVHKMIFSIVLNYFDGILFLPNIRDISFTDAFLCWRLI